jgi:hypothetical protein
MTKNLPRLELSSTVLAEWLERQDPDLWWLVDGDPVLTGTLSFPCPGDVLAGELRRINQPLLLIPPESAELDPGKRPVSSHDLDDPVYLQEKGDDRTFSFRWARSPSPGDWMLIEDRDSAKLARGLDDSEEG